MNLRTYLSTLLWTTTVFFCLTAATLRADDKYPISQVTLGSITDAYQLANNVEGKLKKDGTKLEEVELFHFGDTFPVELDALVEKFLADGVKRVLVRNVTEKEFNALIESERLKQIDNDALAAAKMIAYSTGNKNLDQVEHDFKTSTRKRWDEVRHSFGVPNGITLAYYRWDGPRSKKTFELGVGLTKAFVMGQVIYHSVLQSAAHSHVELNATGAVAVGVAFGLFFDVFQRGNSNFKGQGKNYDPDTGKIYMNEKLFYMLGFMHTFLMRQSMMIAANTHLDGFSLNFTMGWNDFFHTLFVSALGVVGRIPVEMLIEKLLGKNRESWAAWGVLTAWGLLYSTMQAVELFSAKNVMGLHVGEAFRYTLMILGGLSIPVKLFVNRKRIARWFERIRDRKNGTLKEKVSRCQTLLLYKAVPIIGVVT